jgi:hypothetical protein
MLHDPAFLQGKRRSGVEFDFISRVNEARDETAQFE